MLHNVRVTSREVNIFPSLVENSLLSTSKFADAGYTAIYNKNEVNFYDAKTTKITVSADAMLKGWCSPRTNFWRAPLFPIVTNLNTDTLIMDHPSGQNSLNSMYTSKQTRSPVNMWRSKCAIIIARSTSTTYTKYPTLNQPFATALIATCSRERKIYSILRRIVPGPKHHMGQAPVVWFDGATIGWLVWGTQIKTHQEIERPW